ncbi:MAG: hypothetical protein PHR77_03320 [Kiritimatiellae bacterium]|nr:hypothetical protein [Kiritimatiellia bacterium]MDD5519587.1 hypothetical protein [Kiritimatiellia bacterium]
MTQGKRQHEQKIQQSCQAERAKSQQGKKEPPAGTADMLAKNNRQAQFDSLVYTFKYNY